MIDDAVLALLQTRLHQQWLVPRALDAAADALRHWHATHARPLALDTLALYAHSRALDLTDPAAPHVVTRVDIGVPALLAHVAGDFIDVGTFWFETSPDGYGRNETLTIEHDQAAVDRWLTWTHAPGHPPIPNCPVNAHGATSARTILYHSTPAAAIPAPLLTDLAGALDIAGRAQATHAAGYALIAEHFMEEPADYGPWTPATITLRTTSVRLVFRLDEERPVLVKVALDVVGTPPAGAGEPQEIGSYSVWTRLDGTVDDDSYTLWIHPQEIPVAQPHVPGVPAELLIDLGYLDTQRQATLGRLVEAVGTDGLRRLLAEARTRLAELALNHPPPTAPKSVRGMLWHMLQHDALDPTTRATVLGLTRPRKMQNAE